MGKISREGVRRGLAVLGVLALVLTACDPGKTTAVAGTGASGNTGDGGAATAATLEQPGSIVALPDGSFDVADDAACVIRHVATDGTISTIAGTGTCGYSGDGGPATAAQIDPQSVEIFAATGHLAADTAGNLYLNDSGNTRIRKIDTTGTITTVADGSDGLSSCSGPAGFTVTPDGTVYVGCQGELAKVLPDGTLEEVLAANAMSLASDADGNLYFDDYYTGFIKELDTTGTVTNVTNLTSTLGLDSYGDLPIATDLAIGPDGSLYAALGPTDMVIPNPGFYTPPTVNPADRHVVVRIDAGTPTVIAGTGAADPGTGAQTGYGRELNLDPYGIAIASDGGLLASSGHVVYHLADTATAKASSGSICDPSGIYPGKDLSGADLHGVNLDYCDLTGVNFSGVNLSGANLSHDTFDGTNLTGADLSGANLTASNGSGIVGTPTAMPAGWTIGAGRLLGPGTNLAGADLSNVDLTGVNLSGRTCRAPAWWERT